MNLQVGKGQDRRATGKQVASVWNLLPGNFTQQDGDLRALKVYAKRCGGWGSERLLGTEGISVVDIPAKLASLVET